MSGCKDCKFCATARKHFGQNISKWFDNSKGKEPKTLAFITWYMGGQKLSLRVVNKRSFLRVPMRKCWTPACWCIPGRSTIQNSVQPCFGTVLSHPSLLELHIRYGRPALVRVRACVSSDPRRVLGAVGYLGAGAVVVWIRCPEENIINHQDESSHGHAEEIDNGHRHFHPNLGGHAGVFGPQLPGVARPPLHVPVQLLGGRGDLSASRFHVGRLWRGPTLATDVSPDSCLLIRVWTAESAAPPLFPSTTLLWSCACAGCSLSRKKVCLQEVKSLVPLRAVLMEITELKEDVPGISWTGPLSTPRCLIRPFPGGPFKLNPASTPAHQTRKPRQRWICCNHTMLYLALTKVKYTSVSINSTRGGRSWRGFFYSEESLPGFPALPPASVRAWRRLGRGGAESTQHPPIGS